MKKQNKGFTLTELLVTVGMLSVTASIASYAYIKVPIRAQSLEAEKMVYGQIPKINSNLALGRCTQVSGVDDIFKAKFGTLTISGTPSPASGPNCPTGCTAKFVFNDSGTNKQLSGKILSLKFLNSGKFAVDVSKTTLDNKYIHKTWIANETAAASCSSTGVKDAEITPGGSTPPTDAAPDLPNPNPSNPPVEPPGNGSGGEVIEPEPPISGTTPPDSNTGDPNSTDPDTNKPLCDAGYNYVAESGETVLKLTPKQSTNVIPQIEVDFHTLAARYMLGLPNFRQMPAVNLKAEFQATLGRAPKENEKITFIIPCDVAVISTEFNTPIIDFSGFPKTVEMNLLNYGGLINSSPGVKASTMNLRSASAAGIVGTPHNAYAEGTYKGFKTLKIQDSNPQYNEGRLNFWDFSGVSYTSSAQVNTAAPSDPQSNGWASNRPSSMGNVVFAHPYPPVHGSWLFVNKNNILNTFSSKLNMQKYEQDYLTYGDSSDGTKSLVYPINSLQGLRDLKAKWAKEGLGDTNAIYHEVNRLRDGNWSWAYEYTIVRPYSFTIDKLFDTGTMPTKKAVYTSADLDAYTKLMNGVIKQTPTTEVWYK